MSTIKYRQWTGDRFYYWGFGVQDDGAYFTGPVSGGNLRVADQIHEQFTGLTDASGVEIYQGDIVRWDDASKGKLWRVAQVVWHENGTWAYRIIPSACVGCFKDGKGHDFKLGNFIYTPDGTAYGNVLEVIGNIHQNPELLESSNKT